MTSARSPVESARVLFERGWSPLPVQFKGKTPMPSIAKGWQHLRLAAEDLEHHFRGPTVNVGVILGSASGGLMDVDLDSVESVRLADEFLPETGAVFGRTGKPNSHRLFVVSEPARTQHFKDVDGTMLVELRGDGSQTVFPDSVHMSGELIRWSSERAPAHLPLHDLQGAVQKLAAAALLARHWPARGGRHDATLALAGWLARAGWEESDVVTFVCAVTRAAGDDEADRREADIRSTFNRILSGGTVTGWKRLAEIVADAIAKLAATWLGIAPEAGGSPSVRKTPRVHRGRSYVPFPVEELPEPLSTFVNEFSKSLNCDAAYLAVPMLGVLAAAIGNSRTIRLKRGWSEPAIIWCAIVALSGTVKSPALDAATEPVREFERRSLQEFRDAVADWKRRKNEYKRALKDFNAGELEAPPDEPESPAPKRFMCEDTTIEGLAVVLCDNERGVVVIRDELSGWLRSFNQYRGGRGGDEARWLSVHGGRSITIDRKTGGRTHIHIPHALVSVVGCIQPGVLGSALSEDHMQSGMAARLLFAYPPKRAKQWSDAEVTARTKDDYRRVLGDLYGLLPAVAEDGSTMPVELGLTPEARTAWIDFYNEQAAEQIAMTGKVAAAWSKLEGYAARLALVVHCVRQVAAGKACTDEVDLTSIKAGIALSRWFGNEALRVYEMLEGRERDREINERLDVVVALGGRVSVREWHRKRKARSADVARAELAELVTSGLGRWERPAPSQRGGRPQEWFVANPCDTTPAGEDEEWELSPPHSQPEGAVQDAARAGDPDHQGGCTAPGESSLGSEA